MSAISDTATREGRKGSTHLEPSQRLVPILIAIDNADGALATRAGRGVVEPERLAEVFLEDGHSEDRDRGPIHCVARAGVEAVDGDVRVVRRDAGRGERRLRRGVVACRDCSRVNIRRKRDKVRARTIEDDGVANDCVDALRLEGRRRIITGFLSTDRDHNSRLRCYKRRGDELVEKTRIVSHSSQISRAGPLTATRADLNMACILCGC